jgi:hypothetical protein
MASTRILATGIMLAGCEIAWRIAPQHVMDYEELVLPPLQNYIDAAAELEALQDAMEDEEYHRRGGW